MDEEAGEELELGRTTSTPPPQGSSPGCGGRRPLGGHEDMSTGLRNLQHGMQEVRGPGTTPRTETQL